MLKSHNNLLSETTDEHKNRLDIMKIEAGKDLNKMQNKPDLHYKSDDNQSITNNLNKMKFTTVTMSNTFSDEIHCNLNDNEYVSMPDFTTGQLIVKPLDIIMEDDKEKVQKARSKTEGKNAKKTMK